MAELIRKGYDLPVLRISCRPGGRNMPSVALFEAVRGMGEPELVAECPLHELNAPERQSDLPAPGAPPLRDADFRLPATVLAAIREAAGRMGPAATPPSRALWLEVAAPRGLLHLLPWERLLAALDRPVLRLPSFLLRPRSSAGVVQVVLCVPDGDEDADRDVVRMCRAWRRATDNRVRIQVFAHPALYRRLRRQPGLTAELALHDPYRKGSTADAGPVTDPWLGWVSDALGGTAVDVVQVMTPGCLLAGRGGIPLLQAAAAEDRWRRVVGAVEMAGFLGAIGAWGLMLTGVGRTTSMPGLRELGDTVSQLVPGTVIVQDYRYGDQLQTESAVDVAVGQAQVLSGAVRSLTCWTHPTVAEVSADEQQQLMVGDGGESVLLGASTRTVLEQAETPGWLAAGSRFLETQQSKWLGDPGLTVGNTRSAPTGAMDTDVAAALGSVAALLDRHAAAYLAGQPGGGPPTGGSAPADHRGMP